MRTAVNDLCLSRGEPTIEQEFAELYAGSDDVPAEAPAALVAYLASGAADALSGRNLDITRDLAELVTRANEIEEHDLYVLRERE